MSLSEKQGENRTGTGDGGILALLLSLHLTSALFLLVAMVSFDMFSPAVSFLFFTQRLVLMNMPVAEGHDCPLHFHTDGSNPDSSGH